MEKIVTCSSCAQKNRVTLPLAPGQHVRCGACQAGLGDHRLSTDLDDEGEVQECEGGQP